MKDISSQSVLATALVVATSIATPHSNLNFVNPLIGNAGDTPNGSGGMIPSVGSPFGSTRWVAQTHENYVSRLPYNCSDSEIIHGFSATRQPAIWMGESGGVTIQPGVGTTIRSTFEERGLQKVSNTEHISPASYWVRLERGIGVNMSATSHVGQLAFTFDGTQQSNETVYVVLEASRASTMFSVAHPGGPGEYTTVFPTGGIQVFEERQEICGYNSEIQDARISPSEVTGDFKGWFCARFDAPFLAVGITYGQNKTTIEGVTDFDDAELLTAYATFSLGSLRSGSLDIRVGTSLISLNEARVSIDEEIPDGTSLKSTIAKTKKAWAEKLDQVRVEGGSENNRTVFLTAAYHALQYPYEQSERGKYYSGHDGKVHNGVSYTGYSIWDTFRAEWAFLILMVPERIPDMIQSMLQDYQESGWLPMWKNIVETNIMVATHADSLIAEAYIKGIQKGYDLDLAWEALWKDSTVAPLDDLTVPYFDRQENVSYEARAGLSSSYASKGWVANDVHSESASRTMDYAYDDYAVAEFARAMGKPADIVDFLYQRALSAPFTLYNNESGFMEARNANGSWAGESQGWTEGDKWAYSFDVVHDVTTLIEKRGGRESFVLSLDQHFQGGHNDHTNEPSHHIPYLYSLAGAATKTQEKVREIARTDYNNTPNGLSGNEDCGQMSAWYIFSALGFYPVNPVSGVYVVGSPFFDRVTIALPWAEGYLNKTSPNFDENLGGYRLTVTSYGAPNKPYVKSLHVNGVERQEPIIRHEEIRYGADIVFEMSDSPQPWGNVQK